MTQLKSAPAGFDPEAAKHAEGQFKHKGIHMNPDFSPIKVVKEKDGKLTMTAKNNDDKEVTLDGIDYILMATGRKPATQGLGLDKVLYVLHPKPFAYLHSFGCFWLKAA